MHMVCTVRRAHGMRRACGVHVACVWHASAWCVYLLALLDRLPRKDDEVRAILTQALDCVDGVHLGVGGRHWHG